MIDVLNKALRQVNDNFTSNEFYNQLRRLNVSEKFIRNSKAAFNFLEKNAERIGEVGSGKRSRHWRKKQVQSEQNSNGHTKKEIPLPFSITDDEVDYMIQTLKSLGYKVLREEKQFVEI